MRIEQQAFGFARPLTVGKHSLGYSDRIPGHAPAIRSLPRQHGEPRAEYVRRFFAEIRGLGHIRLHYGVRTIVRRGW